MSKQVTNKRYPTDLTDEQWAKLEALLPPRAATGRPPKYSQREIVNGMLYVLRGGISWRMMPSDLPPWRSVYWYFMIWRNCGLFEQINDTLRKQVRTQAGKDQEPSGAVIDSQSVKVTEKGGHLDTADMTQARM
jgi:putative transposase